MVRGLWAAACILAVAQAGCGAPPAAPAPTPPSTAAAAVLPTFLAVSDIHLNRNAGSVTYGQDTGEELWGFAKAELATLLSRDPAPRFAVFLGDLPAHDDGASHEADIRDVLVGLAGLARAHHVPMLYVPGNNDSPEGDYCPLSWEGRSPLTLDPDEGWPLAGGDGMCDATEAGACILDEDGTWGWVAAYPIRGDRGLRVIALNTVLLSTATFCDDHLADAERRAEVDRQLAWLRGQLADARSRGEKVIVAMHVFPGRDGYSGKLSWRPLREGGSTAQDRFLAEMLEYRDVVAGVLTGHSHTEEIRRLCARGGACDDDLFGVALSAPGVTPQHGNNPGIKLVSYDRSYAPVDFETFYTPPQDGRWSSYTFRQATGCPADRRTIVDCVRWMGTDGLAAFENGYYDVLSGKGVPRFPRRMLDIRFGDVDPGA